jgi:hypothetical protein
MAGHAGSAKTPGAGKGGTGGSSGQGGSTSSSGGAKSHAGAGGSHPKPTGAGGTTNVEMTAGAGDVVGQGGERVTGAGGTVTGPGDTGGAGASGSECDATPVILATVPEAWALALDGGYAYFTTNTKSGSVLRVPLTGGDIQILEAGELFPHQIAVADGRLFWVSLGSEPGHLYQATLTGDDRHQIQTEPPAVGDPSEPGVSSGMFALSADANNVYYIANLNDSNALPIAGGTVTKLGGGPYDSLIVDMVLQGQSLFYTNNGVSAFEPAQSETAAVLSVDVGGTTAAFALENRLDYPQFAIAANADSVFWSDATAIYRTSHDGGDYQTLAPLPPALPDESPIGVMVADQTDVFYSDGKAIHRLPVGGGKVETVTDGWTAIERLALTDDSVIFTDSKRGVVVAVRKCAFVSGGDTGEAGAGGQGAGSGGSAGSTALGGSGGQAGSAQAGTSSQGGFGGIAGTDGCGVIGCPAPEAVATVANPYGLAVDESYLYFSIFSATGGVMRVPLAGGDPEPVVTGQNQPHDLAVDDQNVYYGLLDNNSGGHLGAVPKSGGTGTIIATGIASPVSQLAADAGFVYYLTGYNSVYRVFGGGGTSAVVAAGRYGNAATDLVVAGSEVFWVNAGAYDSTFSHLLPGTGYIGSTPVSGRPDLGHHALASGLTAPQMIAVDANAVYFVDGTSVYRHPRSGGSTEVLGPIAPAASGKIVHLVSDGNHLYFADQKAVYRMPVSGGQTETLTGGWGNILALAVDATSVYFTDNSGGMVLKRPK